MEVILLERVAKLGSLGQVVKVKDGYARNFLLRRGKALRATDANKAKFDSQRATLEAKNAELRKSAQEEAKGLDGKSFVIIRQAGESGQLYGSVIARAISPKPHPRPAWPSNAATCCSTRRSRRLACTRSPSPPIPKWK